MSNERLSQLVSKLDRLILEVLVPLRSSKTIDSAVFQRLESALSELGDALHDEELVPKALAGNLLFLFTTMLTEAEHAKEGRQAIETAAWAIEESLRRIFGPHF